MERANKHTVINMEMNNKLKLMTYDCKHFVCGGHTFDFLNSLFCEADFLLLSEHWLYEFEFYKLSSLGRSAGVVATSAMDQHKQRVGRPYGGTAIVWHSSIKGKVKKIDCDDNRLCAALYTKDNMTMLLVNVYMPCDNNCHDDDFINILSDVSLLFYRYNPSHVVFGGDMNVDLSRTSPKLFENFN